ncbi:NUDIX hydrolase [Salinimonas sp. HHU 13199]|uniref:GDP-mannose pyrophosphatase n=1 Tax=Salinimonas profundi TaxID=2729140 RepID=A0ABR8LFG3_9ALTE|nr:NUDIX hydrolase [Salinimonas profundi]MBD3585001.1 NUDIX hydrolase [Salinimonas profundi]
MTVREDEIERPSGAKGLYSVVEKPHFAIIIPVHNHQVYMVEQYRYPVGERQLEFPQGTWDDAPGVDPLTLAAGELKEETGLTAGTMEHVGFQYLAYGMCNQGYHIYLARELTAGEQQLDPEEEGLTVHQLSLDELDEKIISGQIKDASTCNALGLARLKGYL